MGSIQKIQPDSLKTKLKMQEKLTREFFRDDLKHATDLSCFSRQE